MKKKNDTPLFDEKKYNKIINKLNKDLEKLHATQTALLSERAEAKAEFEANKRNYAEELAASAMNFPKDVVELTQLALKLTAEPSEVPAQEAPKKKKPAPRKRSIA